jgi:peptide/nickel transport system substrate-binding protein
VKPRFIGVIVTAALLGGVYVYWRSSGGASVAPAEAPPSRGGQLVATVRAVPRSFNRYVARDQTVEVINVLTQGRLVRINRATFDLEPWLAEKWETAADGRTHTLHLRPGVTWSDGAPFSSADVLFSLDAIFDRRSNSVLASSLTIGGKPITATAPDAQTVVISYPGPSGPGIRLLDSLTIFPKHKLEAALASGRFASTWDTATPPAEIVGTGPFVMREHQPGQRIVFDRNPRYWRKAQDGGPLPYLDRLILEIVPDQNAELLRLQSGNSDLLHSELRSEDYVPVKRSEGEGRLRLIEMGVGPDADAFWFCLKPEAKRKDPRFAFVQKREFRQAISYAVDREAFAETVFLGAAVPVWGPITPGNRPWFWPDVPRYPHDDAKATALLGSIGLEDRNANGVVEDEKGTEARFTVLTQRGLGYSERGTAVLRDEAAKVGIALDIAPMEFGAMIERLQTCDYDAIYMRPLWSDLDPAMSLDYWLSSGDTHFWNLAQRTPGTDWEQRIDTIMLEQAATTDPERRRALFNDAQRNLAENLPVLYFAAPRMYGAYSARLQGVVPSVLRPNMLWSADTISVARGD